MSDNKPNICIFFKQDITMLPRLAQNSLCSLGQPQTYNCLPASISSVLGYRDMHLTQLIYFLIKSSPRTLLLIAASPSFPAFFLLFIILFFSTLLSYFWYMILLMQLFLFVSLCQNQLHIVRGFYLHYSSVHLFWFFKQQLLKSECSTNISFKKESLILLIDKLI